MPLIIETGLIIALLALIPLRRRTLAALRIGKHLVDAIDRPAWHPGLIEPGNPVVDRILDEALLEDRVQRIAIF